MAAAAVLKIPFPVLGIVSFCKYIVINVGLSPVGFLDTTGSGNERVMGGGLPPLVGGGIPSPILRNGVGSRFFCCFYVIFFPLFCHKDLTISLSAELSKSGVFCG